MSLTIEIEPDEISAVYNPVKFQFASDVRSDYTIGDVHTIVPNVIVNNNGYVEISYDVDHLLLAGDFVKITDNGGITGLDGVWLIREVIDADSYVINCPYTETNAENVLLYKFLRNYSCVIRVFAYNLCDANYQLIAKLLFKPLFSEGYCYFRTDIANILKNYNNECNTEIDNISADLMPLINIPDSQINNKSFLSYYISYAEGFDNPVVGTPEYVETIPEEN
jgi:hypothetical protein